MGDAGRRGDGGLLGGVLVVHHRELEELLVEAMRDTPTAGVVTDIASVLERRTLIHLAGVERAVWPRVADVDPVSLHPLVDNHDQLRATVGRFLDDARAGQQHETGELLQGLLADHEALEESVVVPVLERELGWRGLWLVGNDLTAEVDTEPTWAPRG